MATMKAYRWHGPDSSSMKLEETPIPVPNAGEVLIQVQACGLCHSDCHILNGSQSASVTKRPITLGHEVSGNIIKLGLDVTEAKIGDRICVSLGGHPDRPPHVIGLTMNGGYAEYAVAKANMLVHIPDDVSWEQAAVLTDSLTTAYHAVVVAGEVKQGDVVAIVGLGGLGSTAARIACLQGATVYGFDIDAKKFPAALESGVKECHASLTSIPDIKFDTILDFVGLSKTIQEALISIRFRGRIILVGIGEKDITVPLFGIIFVKAEIRGCLGGSKEDMKALLGLIRTGLLKPVLEEVPFELVNESLHRLEEGGVEGRMFTRPGKGRGERQNGFH